MTAGRHDGVGVAEVAALYVQRGGVYWGDESVDPWDETRDARRYGGQHPVVAHPPCARWGRYWSGGPSSHGQYELGDDGGCFEAALASVRRWGGVLEHPAGSHAWAAHGLARPATVGWTVADGVDGWVCVVEQGHYGHVARKPTWLYAVGIVRPELAWGPSEPASRPDTSGLTEAERRRVVRRGAVELLSHRQRAATPRPFATLLLAMARTAGKSSLDAGEGRREGGR